MTKINVPFFYQNADHTCGPAAVQMALAYFGLKVSQEELEKEMDPCVKCGTHRRILMQSLEDRGLAYQVKSQGSLSDIKAFLKQKLLVIVRYLEPDSKEPHYAVVTGVGSASVVLNDPWHGANFKLDSEEFLKRWQEAGYSNNRWLMAVSKA